MEVKIWSDVRCPFCYIGKRKFEAALENFPHKEEVKVSWRSFQLDPNLKTSPETSTIEYFEKTKGISRDQATQMLGHATRMAKEVGLDFHLEEAVLANSFKAHRLIQMAKTEDLGGDMEEVLFKAHFTEKKNIDDSEVLTEIGVSVGLEKEQVKEVLASDAFEKEVKQDEIEAKRIGVQGVPFFVVNDKYGISGAQSPDAFLQTLEKAWEEYQKENPSLVISKGESCSTDGTCD